MYKILVTGSSGFVGKSLVRKLLNKGYEVVGLDLHKSPNLPTSCEQIEMDITDSNITYLAIWEEIDYVYHLAAMANVDVAHKYHKKCIELNVMGTSNIVEICQKYNIPLCYISTCCTYGTQTKFPTSEENLPSPNEIYGATKLMGEWLVRLLPRWVILRYGTIIGPEMREALMTHIFLTSAINKQSFPIKGDGLQTRTWIYIDDLIDATTLVMEKNINHEIINVAGLESPTVMGVAHMCQQIVNKYPTISIDLLPQRYGDTLHEEIDISKAKRILGWNPKVKVYDALERCYKAWSNKK